MQSIVDPSRTTKSPEYRGSTSFASFMIIGPTCFFLGILFAMFPYDYPLLWSKAAIDPAYYDTYEEHLKFLHNMPPLISRLLHITASVVFAGFALKMYRASEANYLFDGASIILYLIAVAVYSSNTIKGLRTVSADIWKDPKWQESREGRYDGEVVLGRLDSLKVVAASNTILALVFVGVLVLQAGQWYAEIKELDIEKEEELLRAAEARMERNKKKQ